MNHCHLITWVFKFTQLVSLSLKFLALQHFFKVPVFLSHFLYSCFLFSWFLIFAFVFGLLCTTLDQTLFVYFLIIPLYIGLIGLLPVANFSCDSNTVSGLSVYALFAGYWPLTDRLACSLQLSNKTLFGCPLVAIGPSVLKPSQLMESHAKGFCMLHFHTLVNRKWHNIQWEQFGPLLVL